MMLVCRLLLQSQGFVSQEEVDSFQHRLAEVTAELQSSKLLSGRKWISLKLGVDSHGACCGCANAKWVSRSSTERCHIHCPRSDSPHRAAVRCMVWALHQHEHSWLCVCVPEFLLASYEGKARNKDTGRFEKTWDLSVDLLVITPQGDMVAVEFDGASHRGQKQADYDRFKERVLQDRGVPLLRVEYDGWAVDDYAYILLADKILAGEV